MREFVDVRVIDWGIAGHELPFISNVTEAFRSEGLVVAVSLPTDVIDLHGYRSLRFRFDCDAKVVFDPFTTKMAPRRPRRMHKFLTSFLTCVSIRQNSGYQSRFGNFFTTINTFFHPLIGTTQSMLNSKWAGHILHPSVSESALSLNCVRSFGSTSHCRGIGLTDERLIKATNERFKSRFQTFNFPEFADLTVSEAVNPRSRPTCLLIGALSSYKNVVSFARLAESHPNIDFHLAGPLTRDQYSRSELALIDGCAKLRNVIRTDRYLADGLEFNDLIRSADVVWLNYNSFEHSSNVQIKANAFGIPCLVSNSGLIYHRRKSSDIVCWNIETVNLYLSTLSAIDKPLLHLDLQRQARLEFIESLAGTNFLV